MMFLISQDLLCFQEASLHTNYVIDSKIQKNATNFQVQQAVATMKSCLVQDPKNTMSQSL